ncbi:sensor domain-containing protein [Thalassotalea agariperforans]
MKLFNKALEQSEACLGVLTLDNDGLVVDVNDSYIVMTGFKKEELIDKPISTFISAGNRQVNSDIFHSTLLRQDGSVLPIEVCVFEQTVMDSKQTLLFVKDVTYFDNVLSKLSIIEKIFHSSNEAVMITDRHGYIHTINNSFSAITGYTEAEVIGKTPAILNSGKQDQYFYQKFWQALIKKGCWEGEIWNKRKNGEIYPEWLMISSVKDSQEQITHYICQFSDITQRKKSEEEKHFQAYHDALTNLPNRNLLFEKLRLLSESYELTSVYFAVLFCDLDRFKFINDALGHEVGDELLIAIAHRFEKKFRENDIVARSGGDEFIIVIESEKSVQYLDKVCQQILAIFEQPFKTKFGDFKISMSIGASKFPDDSTNVRELISFADSAMHKVKLAGGNDYAFFDIKEKRFIQQRIELEREISDAIKNQHFEVWYQPQINAQTNEVYGLECLLRWNHPTQGMIRPDLFIPLAEANGSIKELGYFVLKTACKQLRQWRIDGIFTGVMAINVSLRQFDRNDLFSQVRDTLINEMIPAESIEIEVTESLFSADNNLHIETLSALRELGVKVAIDDFGTGYSSLQRLKTLPIDNVKIDKCFVDNIEHSKEDVAIISSLILLSKTFGVSLIAEGVETEGQAQKLNELGCYNHQGYLYGKAMTSIEFESWLNVFSQRLQCS